MPGSGTPGAAGRLLRIVIALLLGGWLCWQIGAIALATLGERSADPRLLAVIGTPSHPEAGALLADTMLAGGDTAGAAALARPVVLADPTNDRALRVLGIATEKLGDRDGGAAIMYQAGGLGWRDTPTQLWILHDAAVRGDAVTVIQRADALARRNRSTDLTRAVFLAALDEPGLRTALVDSLGKRPVWRAAFFADIGQRLPARSIPGLEALLGEMRARRQPIAPGEWLDYIDRLVDLGDFARARATWARVFAVPAGRLTTLPYDPDFALAAARTQASPPPGPFEWTLNPDLTGTVAFAGGRRGSALSIPAELTAGTTVVSQLTLLPPGPHALSATIAGTTAAAPVEWTVTCLPSGQVLPRRLARGDGDALSAVAFDVPATGCGGQRLALVARDRLGAQAVSIERVAIR